MNLTITIPDECIHALQRTLFPNPDSDPTTKSKPWSEGETERLKVEFVESIRLIAKHHNRTYASIIGKYMSMRKNGWSFFFGS